MFITEEFKASSAQCLVLNQISKHNMRSDKNVLIPVGELGCCGGKSDNIKHAEKDCQNISTKKTGSMTTIKLNHSGKEIHLSFIYFIQTFVSSFQC